MKYGTFEVVELLEGEAPDQRGVKFHEPLKLEWYQTEKTENSVKIDTYFPNGMHILREFRMDNPHPAGNIREMTDSGIETAIRNMLAFEFAHSFFHDTQDPNYGTLNWAIYGNFKDLVTLVETDEKPNEKPEETGGNVDSIQKLAELLAKIEGSDLEKEEYLTDGDPEELPENIQEAVLTATANLINNKGEPNREAITRLKEAGYTVTAGETDSFGWLSGVIHTQKGKIVFG